MQPRSPRQEALLEPGQRQPHPEDPVACSRSGRPREGAWRGDRPCTGHGTEWQRATHSFLQRRGRGADGVFSGFMSFIDFLRRKSPAGRGLAAVEADNPGWVSWGGQEAARLEGGGSDSSAHLKPSLTGSLAPPPHLPPSILPIARPSQPLDSTPTRNSTFS